MPALLHQSRFPAMMLSATNVFHWLSQNESVPDMSDVRTPSSIG